MHSLQVLRGSNRLGRIEHGRVGGQTGADANRVNEILKHLPVDHVVLDPGDVLYFHCNLLHKSNRNESQRRRWALLSAYNRASNDPFIRHPWPTYTPLNKVTSSSWYIRVSVYCICFSVYCRYQTVLFFNARTTQI